MDIKMDAPSKEQLSAIRRAKRALADCRKLNLKLFASEGELEVHYIENYNSATNIDSGFGGLFIDGEHVEALDLLGDISH